MTSCQTFYCTNKKGECEKNYFFCNYRSGLPLSTHRPVTTKNTEKYDIIGDKAEKKTCVRIKRVKSDSYLTYGQSCKTYMELYVDTLPPPPPPKEKNTNKLSCFMKMQHGMGMLRTQIRTIYKL